ncbi:MAG: outer membrane protein assembly factor BamE, partial [Akkermansiaceae bacterium]|nr:outer membrane protein assembly factor BamE [Akkermansiaceae bacterium]
MGRTVPFLLALCLAACSTPAYQLQQGMTKRQVTTRLGPPLRIERAPTGRETWFYNAVDEKRVSGINRSDPQPGE